MDGFVSWLHRLRFLHRYNSSYGALTFTPVGLSPTEHASFHWTHIPTVKCGRGLNSLFLISLVLLVVAELFVPVLDDVDPGRIALGGDNSDKPFSIGGYVIVRVVAIR